jgi:hypothetical protein
VNYLADYDTSVLFCRYGNFAEHFETMPCHRAFWGDDGVPYLPHCIELDADIACDNYTPVVLTFTPAIPIGTSQYMTTGK